MSTTVNFTPYTQYVQGTGGWREVLSASGPSLSFTRIATSGFSDASFSSFTIPANSLISGASYTVLLEFDYDTTLDSSSILGAYGTAVYANQTLFTITAIPEPSTYAVAIGAAIFAVAVIRRRRMHSVA